MSTISSDTSTLPYTTLSPAEEDPILWGLRRSAWIKIGIVSLLFSAVFWPNLRRLWNKTNPFYGDPNWQHGVVIPLIGLYYLFVNREQLLKAKVKPAWSGLAIMLGGLLMSIYSVYPLRNDFAWDFFMVVTLFGLVVLLCGWDVMRTAWFPILFLLCALPWPPLIYSRVAWPLQELAAKVAVKTLEFVGVDAGRAGTKIFYIDKGGETRSLLVAEACAGMRSLMTFISVAAAVAFLSARPMWQKLIITASAVPIAVFCNVMRVSGQGLLDRYWSHDFAEGFAHTFVGLVMLVPGFFLVLMVGWLLDHIFIDEVDEEEKMRLAGAAAAGGVRSKIVIPAQKAAAVKSAAAPKAPAAPEKEKTLPVQRPASAPSATPAVARAVPTPPPPAGGGRTGRLPPRPGMTGVVRQSPAPPRKPPKLAEPTQSDDINRENA